MSTYAHIAAHQQKVKTGEKPFSFRACEAFNRGYHQMLRKLGMKMKTNRLEAFSDGVIAVIITIMVLELKTPHGNDLATLRPSIPMFLSYILSFIYIGICFNLPRT